MSKYARFEKCRESRVYQEIVVAATDDLTLHGFFAYADVLDRTGHDVFIDSIRWDYVQKMIESAHETELIFLSAAYFKRHKKAEEITIPGHFVATNRKRSVGMAIATKENGHFVRHVLIKKRNAIVGLQTAANKTITIATTAGIADLPQLEGPTEPAQC